jgi:hypothetical protein
MKKIIYIILAVMAAALFVYTGYYAINHKATPVVATVATTTPIVATTTQPIDTSTYTTKSGKKIKVIETNPTGDSLSTITITTTGFGTNTPLILETNKLTNFFYADINNDSYEELILTTMSQGSGGYGDAIIYTTASDTLLLPVTIPQISENDTKKGGLFEGYMGHDSFTVANGNLVREFPTYNKTDTNDSPTGPTKSIIYSLVQKKGMYSVTFIKSTTTPLASTKAVQQASTSASLIGTTTAK